MAPEPSPRDRAPERGSNRPAHHRSLLATSLAAVGVVFGDIGTSPLYTLQVAAERQPGGQLAREDVFGVVSLVLWALLLAVSIKYVTFVMRATNDGEGGILTMLALLPGRFREAHGSAISLLVIAGAALLFGDGMITPSISVLSALEGLHRAEPRLGPWVVPLTCAVLVGLFSLQRRGIGVVGRLFGPVMVLWFITIAALGFKEILKNPQILGAISPGWGLRYFARHGLPGVHILGVVVLAITGGEALYADVGFFGRGPIRASWFALVFPSLALSYMGQGALVLREPGTIARPFFFMVPPGAPAHALVFLAAAATVIASQALISGVFSLTEQAVHLGYFPRVKIVHTSDEARGHIYIPVMNWGLMVVCVALVLGFGRSERLASAYGIAVSGTMAITSLVFFEVMRTAWHWSLARALPLLVLFLSFDVPILAANALKLLDGGYVPILAGAAFFTVMVVWHAGREALRHHLTARGEPLRVWLAALPQKGVIRVPGTAVYLTATEAVPRVLASQVEHLRSVAEDVVLLTFVVDAVPRVDEEHRSEVERLPHGFVRVVLHFGYMEPLRVTRALREALDRAEIPFSLDRATYYSARETFLALPGGEMKPLPERLFAFLSRNTKSITDYLDLPPENVVEYGMRLDL